MTTAREMMVALAEFSRSLGVTFIEVNVEEWGNAVLSDDDIYPCPFSSDLAINWSEKILYYRKGCMEWPNIIHELGHLVATTDPPNDAIEYDFFGWEVALCRHLGGSWDDWCYNNRFYEVCTTSDRDTAPFGKLPLEDRDALVEERWAKARDLGLIDTTGLPQAVR